MPTGGTGAEKLPEPPAGAVKARLLQLVQEVPAPLRGGPHGQLGRLLLVPRKPWVLPGLLGLLRLPGGLYPPEPPAAGERPGLPGRAPGWALLRERPLPGLLGGDPDDSGELHPVLVRRCTAPPLGGLPGGLPGGEHGGVRRINRGDGTVLSPSPAGGVQRASLTPRESGC